MAPRFPDHGVPCGMIAAILTAGIEGKRASVETYWIWVVAGVALLVAELLSGTF